MVNAAPEEAKDDMTKVIEAVAKLKLEGEKDEKDEKEEEAKKKLTLEELAQNLSKGVYKKIVVLTGAGISVNAGIPDFRTPGTGLYSQLEKYKLPFPEAVFTLDFFQDTPEPFFKLASEMFAKKFVPTKSHYFIRMLAEKGLLVRNFTQNIDNLEAESGVDPEKLIQAHGTFTTSHCTGCHEAVSPKEMMECMQAAKPMMCPKCGKPCKPDIVFFGENLPKRYFEHENELVDSCDLLVIMGSSLVVTPFCNLAVSIGKDVPRLIINRELPEMLESHKRAGDVFMPGDCDESVAKLVRLVGWEKEFAGMMEQREKYAKKHKLALPEVESKLRAPVTKAGAVAKPKSAPKAVPAAAPKKPKSKAKSKPKAKDKK